MKSIIRKLKNNKLYKILSDIKTHLRFMVKLGKLNKIRKRKKIILIDTPLYGNIGDQAITIAEQAWINDEFFGYEKFYFTVNEIKLNNYSTLKLIKKLITDKDIICLQGGGHFGDLYIDSEILKRNVVEQYPNNKIILFPSTMNFSDTESGRKEKLKSKAIYDSHKDISVILREEKSFLDAKNTFKNVKLILNPDAVFYLCSTPIQDEINKNTSKENILVCFRRDKETFYNLEEKNNLLNNLKKKYNNIIEQDTNVPYGIREDERKREVIRMVKNFANSKVVITDRYHGMIFSILAKTPCIVLRSKDHKIVESLRWIDKFGTVEYVENIELVYRELEKLANGKADLLKYEELNEEIKRKFCKLRYL
ncbi:polysaccharide pyruvyl transferase family protein [Domibacillus sp. A3M-37]|uniref:polysaccharide pyruvyl transferase family protein n=1 Tax=Domibacillus sp. A3M-37 TaxID=2962037 RepID=UPI0020B79A12|nr:polysaccharide pyruvyl transferase family protein [Domibacillus sp. A3M-37]MCP3761400.1 polysaccharide pyruvyl transferase family protein [Domibacillus sp. A3M-37]